MPNNHARSHSINLLYLFFFNTGICLLRYGYWYTLFFFSIICMQGVCNWMKNITFWLTKGVPEKSVKIRKFVHLCSYFCVKGVGRPALILMAPSSTTKLSRCATRISALVVKCQVAITWTNSALRNPKRWSPWVDYFKALLNEEFPWDDGVLPDALPI